MAGRVPTDTDQVHLAEALVQCAGFRRVGPQPAQLLLPKNSEWLASNHSGRPIACSHEEGQADRQQTNKSSSANSIHVQL
eukprot:SAG22_NODE_73_length_22318_cov_47.105315_3_plen_80_part_00